MSPTLFKERIFPLLLGNKPLFVLVIDNLRYDQWKAIQPMIEEYYRVETDDIYYSILPTTTQYARNSMFSGLMPTEIEKKYPQYWVSEEEEGRKNQYESEIEQFGWENQYYEYSRSSAGQNIRWEDHNQRCQWELYFSDQRRNN